MTEPRTEAGRRLLIILREMAPPNERGDGIDWVGRIERIEAEAALRSEPDEELPPAPDPDVERETWTRMARELAADAEALLDALAAKEPTDD